jgi:hypothetical protein
VRRMPSCSQKNSRRELVERNFAPGIFWGGVSRYATTPLIAVLSPGHSDITRFRSWSPFATGNPFDCAEKILNVVHTTGTVEGIYPRSGITRPTSRKTFACPNLKE